MDFSWNLFFYLGSNWGCCFWGWARWWRSASRAGHGCGGGNSGWWRPASGAVDGTQGLGWWWASDGVGGCSGLRGGCHGHCRVGGGFEIWPVMVAASIHERWWRQHSWEERERERKERHGEREGRKGEERKQSVSQSEYVRRLTGQHTWVVPHKPCPLIFIGQATSPMNISHVYPSVMWPHQWTYEAVPRQPGRPIHSLVTWTNQRT
jgi:hypothetical protein